MDRRTPCQAIGADVLRLPMSDDKDRAREGRCKGSGRRLLASHQRLSRSKSPIVGLGQIEFSQDFVVVSETCELRNMRAA